MGFGHIDLAVVGTCKRYQFQAGDLCKCFSKEKWTAHFDVAMVKKLIWGRGFFIFKIFNNDVAHLR